MKKDIHPQGFRPVVFKDANNGAMLLVHSTVKTEETVKWEDGKEYPLYETEVSSASHPFYTGVKTNLDATGRVDKFNRRKAAAVKSKA